MVQVVFIQWEICGAWQPRAQADQLLLHLPRHDLHDPRRAERRGRRAVLVHQRDRGDGVPYSPADTAHSIDGRGRVGPVVDGGADVDDQRSVLPAAVYLLEKENCIHTRAGRSVTGLRMLTKSTDCRPLKKAARQGGKPAKKGVYPVVNDRILQAKPTQQAENPSVLLSEGFSAFAAFVSGLTCIMKGYGLNYDSIGFPTNAPFAASR